MATIRTTLGRSRLTWECQTCGETRDTGNYGADRMAGRRHAESSGHLVNAYVKRTHRWDGRATPEW